MSEKSSNQSSMKITYKGIGMAIGLIMGGCIGLLIGNVVIFAGGGMVVGLAIGAALD
ncbi:MAG TPA: glycine zipper family protein [Anaerolineae bacterium]|nr:glycine zipper family protein [Anaerolineae bacterium]